MIRRQTWGGSSAGRALRSQCRGRGFDPLPLHHFIIPSSPKQAGKPIKNKGSGLFYGAPKPHLLRCVFRISHGSKLTIPLNPPITLIGLTNHRIAINYKGDTGPALTDTVNLTSLLRTAMPLLSAIIRSLARIIATPVAISIWTLPIPIRAASAGRFRGSGNPTATGRPIPVRWP
jgi:hypothetical protein